LADEQKAGVVGTALLDRLGTPDNLANESKRSGKRELREIKVLIDDTGRRPKPPAPAFEQIIHGRPWVLAEDGKVSNAATGANAVASTTHAAAVDLGFERRLPRQGIGHPLRRISPGR
jgi:hypothetical protein